MPEEKHRIVIDTNLWISFLLTRDFSKLDQLILADRAILLVSQELLEEIVEVAERPKFRKYFDLSELTDLIVNLKEKAEMVQVTSPKLIFAVMTKTISYYRWRLMGLPRIC